MVPLASALYPEVCVHLVRFLQMRKLQLFLLNKEDQSCFDYCSSLTSLWLWWTKAFLNKTTLRKTASSSTVILCYTSASCFQLRHFFLFLVLPVMPTHLLRLYRSQNQWKCKKLWDLVSCCIPRKARHRKELCHRKEPCRLFLESNYQHLLRPLPYHRNDWIP